MDYVFGDLFYISAIYETPEPDEEVKEVGDTNEVEATPKLQIQGWTEKIAAWNPWNSSLLKKEEKRKRQSQLDKEQEEHQLKMVRLKLETEQIRQKRKQMEAIAAQKISYLEERLEKACKEKGIKKEQLSDDFDTLSFMS